MTRPSAFSAFGLSPNVFLIKESNDIYSENPYIYAIISRSSASDGSAFTVPQGTVILIDTGCGGASNDPGVEITSLREFIETVDIRGQPLNPGGSMNYLVINTHCHYDHILGIEDFSDSLILASSYSPSFLQDIPEHSLCNFLHIRTPVYRPSLVPHGHTIGDTGITLLHTYGHTPDSLSVYDPTSTPPRLYTGDLFYENEPIIFPSEGSIIDWFHSVDMLTEFISTKTKDMQASGRLSSAQSEILLNAGHVTHSEPALPILGAVRRFMEGVIELREPVKKRSIKRGEQTVEYRQDAGKFSLICPERLVLEARAPH